MSREIKFQAYFEESGKMFTHEQIIDELGAMAVFKPGGLKIRQYTGLQDKNGKEIYEGDIVRHNTAPYGVEVEFTKGAFRISSHTLWNRVDSCEVIGNIYSTPELLGKSNG